MAGYIFWMRNHQAKAFLTLRGSIPFTSEYDARLPKSTVTSVVKPAIRREFFSPGNSPRLTTMSM